MNVRTLLNHDWRLRTVASLYIFVLSVLFQNRGSLNVSLRPPVTTQNSFCTKRTWTRCMRLVLWQSISGVTTTTTTVTNTNTNTNTFIFRSTSKSRPNNIREGEKCTSVRTSVRPSTKSFFDLNEIWCIGRGR